MFERILLAYDGSEHSNKAADYAIELAKMHNSKVAILHVRTPYVGYPYENLEGLALVENKLKESAEEIVNAATARLEEAGVDFSSKILLGDPANKICEEAEKNNMNLIIIGSRGLTPVSRFLLGSVSSKVISYAYCPVLVVR